MTSRLKRNILPGTVRIGHADQHDFLTISLEGRAINAVDWGADPDGVNDSSAAAQSAIDSLGTDGGIVFFPPGDYRMDTTVVVPSRVAIRGAGKFATRFFAPAAVADQYMFETDDTVANPETNVYTTQTYGQVFSHFEIRDRASANTDLTPTGRSEDHHGIFIHDTDWGRIESVSIRDLQGYGINMDNLVREWYCTDIDVRNCGDSAESQAAVRIWTNNGDATNTLYFHGCRFIFPEYYGVELGGTQDGLRLIHFIDCQFEGGGSAADPDFGVPWPHSVVYLGYLKTAAFIGCNFANPGEGFYCVDIDGSASSNIDKVVIADSFFNASELGGNIHVNRIDTLSVESCHLEGAADPMADFDIEVDVGSVYVSPDTTLTSTVKAVGDDGHFRGRYDTNKLDYRANQISLQGGGIVPHYSDGQPTATLDLGFTPQDGMVAYDDTNKIFWEKVDGIWIPRPYQHLWKAGEAGYWGSTNEELPIDMTVPGGILLSDTGFEVVAAGWMDFSGGDTTVRWRIKIGGTTIFDVTTASLTIAQIVPWRFQFEVRNVGAVNTNRGNGWWAIGANAAPTDGWGGIGVPVAQGLVAWEDNFDFASDQTVQLTVQLGAARNNIRLYGRVTLV